MAGKFSNQPVTGSLSLLLLLIIMASAFRCDDEKDSEFVFMIFVLPMTVQPAKTEISIGDTLWITGNFPDTIQEYYTNKYHKLTDFDFKSKLCISKLIDNRLYLSQQPGATDNFNVTSQIGSYNRIGSVCGDFNFFYKGEKYFYEIGLVPKASGVYSLNFLWPIDLHGMPEEQIDLRPIIDLGYNSDGRRRIPVYEAFYYVVNNGVTNFELFTQNCKAASLKNPVPINVYYEQKGSFTFRVVE